LDIRADLADNTDDILGEDGGQLVRDEQAGVAASLVVRVES
jgi:hypothetical protein